MKRTEREKEEVHWLIAGEIPALRRYARLLTRDATKSDDLVQDTLERAIKKSHTWRREGNIKSWLYRIQYTVFLNRYRAAHLKETPQQDVVDGTATAIPAPQEDKLECKRVLEAANKLAPRQREVLLLIAVEGFSYDQVAGIMNIPVGTVRSRLARAREELRSEMKRTPVVIKNESRATVRTRT